ncbi:glycoside hydrolase family 16 protein [Armatimonas rosea]|uniref:Beta-glucanase (GH16 family) n=1 Tax=Armatimonas rosea TaxID=685828 RepID=A0A7W9SRI1_ARMRO|nr:glycoside hydrolase family 16 protein [Armatimonas rosea]MBB6051506.1 beta-glucanase (GH16 family) [Armatimonas rosea]
MMFLFPLLCLSQTTPSLVDPQTPAQARPVSVAASDKDRWKLVFSDEFNDTVIDPRKWTVETTTRKRPDILVKSDAEQVEEKDGYAYLYYRKSKTEDNTYFAGRFNSQGHFATTYGYLEARLHLVKPDGYQTAFWMMPDQAGLTAPKGVTDGTANDGAEIDIIEGNKAGDTYSTGLHWDGYAKPAHKSNGAMVKAPGLHTQELHTIGFEWSPTALKFYYDGNLVRTIDKPTLIPQVPHYLIFSGSCFGVNDWVTGTIFQNKLIQDGGTARAYIDYVRVFKRNDTTN